MEKQISEQPTYLPEPFNPEAPQNQLLSTLSQTDDEQLIRSRYTEWCRTVLSPMIDSLLADLEQALTDRPSDPRSASISEQRQYINSAISALQTLKVYYDQALDFISAECSLADFLSLMGTLDSGLELDILNISYGLSDADLSSRYHEEFYPAVLFRYYQARRLSPIDPAFAQSVNGGYQQYLSLQTEKEFADLHPDNPDNPRLLNQFWHHCLHPAICDLCEYSSTRSFLESIFSFPNYEGDIPPLEKMLVFYDGYQAKLEAFFQKITAEPGLETEFAAVQTEILRLAETLASHLSRL